MDQIESMRAFVAVAETQSFTAAATKLGRSKTTVSKQIGGLEDSLGVRLLQRTTRRVGLTDIGGTYLARVRNVLQAIDELHDTVHAAQTTVRGRLRVAAPSTFGELRFMDLVAEFCERHPDVSVEVDLSDQTIDLVGENYDAAIRVSPPEDSSLIRKWVCDVRLLTCAAPSYLATHGLPREPRDLEQHLWIGDTNIRGGNVARYEEGGRVLSRRVTPKITVNGAMPVRQLLLRGAGIGKIPDFLVTSDIASGALVEVLENYTDDREMSLAIVYPHRSNLPTRTRAFIDFAGPWLRRRATERHPGVTNAQAGNARRSARDP